MRDLSKHWAVGITAGKGAAKLLLLAGELLETGSLLEDAGTGFSGFIQAVAVAKPLLMLLLMV